MSERKPSLIVDDILRCIEHIQLYTTDLSFEQFSENFMAMEACLYNLQIIGEAVSRMPEQVKESYPHIPWLLMKGMRNRLIHEYFGTDLQLVWNVIETALPGLKNDLLKIRNGLSEQGN